MATNVKSMTQGRPGKLIITFAIPLVFANVFQQLYTVINAMIVGKVMGVTALAALGVCEWYYWLIMGIIQGVSQGFAILMAQKFGANDSEGLRKAVGNSVVLAGMLTVALLVFSQISINWVLGLLNPRLMPLGIRNNI